MNTTNSAGELQEKQANREFYGVTPAPPVHPTLRPGAAQGCVVCRAPGQAGGPASGALPLG